MRTGLLLIVFSSLLFIFHQKAIAHTDITVKDANSLISSNKQLIIIDIRQPGEYCSRSGHIPGAQNYPWNSGVLQQSYNDFKKTDKILVICRSGYRSNLAAKFLDSKGYKHVYDILGGTKAWINAGFRTTGCVDSDKDGINDDLDNCPHIYNPSQNGTSQTARSRNAPNTGFYEFGLKNHYSLTTDWLFYGPHRNTSLRPDQPVSTNDLFTITLYWLCNCSK